MEFPKFTVTFKDGSTFTGESPTGSWNTMPDKPITSLHFSFGGVSVLLTNFLSYNHLVERLSMVGKSGTMISKYFIMGRLKDTTHVYEFDLRTKRSKKTIVEHGKEYGGQIITGWRTGVSEGQPTYKYGKF